ncbi:hypothetical protein V9T40_003594 [Parthenolecanium corni]|uniref:Uncharacterized protein n=1 Tax=Parthenolecanium corni TaxID=536013 RepID=A0AAN9TVM6_9HEMI
MGGVPKFYGHDPPIAALLVLGMIVRESSFREGKHGINGVIRALTYIYELREDRDEDPAAAPGSGTEEGATREDRELGPRGASSTCMLM